MRPHPLLTLLFAFAISPAQGANQLTSEKLQNFQPQPGVSCGTEEESPSYRKALEMSDAQAEEQCANETGPGLDLCRGVVSFMRDSAKEQAVHKAAFCRNAVQIPVNEGGQVESLVSSAEHAKKMQKGNLGEAELQQGRIDKLKEMKDQMLRRKKGLFQEGQKLAHLDPEIKEHRSVVTTQPYEGSKDPGISSAASDAQYQEYQVARPLPTPKYNPPASQGVIDASTNGSRNLAEYERKIPGLIRQQDRMLKMMESFEEDTKAKQNRHEAAALDLGRHVSTLLLQAGKLETIKEAADMPRKDRPELEPPAAETVVAAKKSPALSPVASASATAANAKITLGVDASPIPRSATGMDYPGVNEEDPEEAAVLESFQTRLMEDGKGKLIKPSSRLRDLLRLQALSRAKSESSSPGELEAEHLGDTIEGDRALASENAKPLDRRGIVRLDVRSAMAEIEAQLEELDRSMGILRSDSEDLFQRVRSVHRRSEKNGIVGPSRS